MNLKFKTLTVAVLAALATTASTADPSSPTATRENPSDWLLRHPRRDLQRRRQAGLISNAAEQGNAEKGFADPRRRLREQVVKYSRTAR
jgi:hypothetical protein